MTATITFVPAAPRATIDFVRVEVAAADQSTLTGYSGTVATENPGSPTQYPASPEVRYYLAFLKSSVELGRSYVFSTNDDGEHVFNNYVFPSAGTWHVILKKASDDSTVKDQTVSVT